MIYSGRAPYGTNQVQSSSLAITVENTDVAVFTPTNIPLVVNSGSTQFLSLQQNKLNIGLISVSSDSNSNIFIGSGSLGNGATGAFNTIIGGSVAGKSLTTGIRNTGVGRAVFENLTIGSSNTAIGDESARNITSGNGHTLIGKAAGFRISEGTWNSTLGELSGFNNSVFLTGSYNTFLGANTQYTDAGISYATAIGHGAFVNQSYQFKLGTDDVNIIAGTGSENAKLTLAGTGSSASGNIFYIQNSKGQSTFTVKDNQSIQLTGSFNQSGSLLLDGNLTSSNALVTGNVIVLGTASINTLVVNQTQYTSGSNQLGDGPEDTQTLFGTVRIPTGSFTVTGSTIISSSAATQLQVGSNLLFVSSSGQVGIGTITPSSSISLDVSGSIRVQSDLFLRNGYRLTNSLTGQTRLGILPPSTGINSFIDLFPPTSTGGVDVGFTVWSKGAPGSNTNYELLEFRYDNPNRRFAFDTLAGGTGTVLPLIFYTQGNDNQLALKTDGNVGIGTSSPNFKLDVSGSGRFSGNLTITGSATNSLIVKGSGATNSTNGLLVQSSAGTTTLEVTDGGTVTVGGVVGYGGTAYTGRASFLVAGGDASSLALRANNYIQVAPGASTQMATFTTSGVRIGSWEVPTALLHITGSTSSALLEIDSPALNNILFVTGSGRVGIGTNNPTSTLSISGSASTSSAALQVYKSGSTVLNVEGSSGQLFSITDSLTGSLFSVNTVAGLPVIEAFSDNTVNIGKYGVYPIKVVASGTLATITGSFTGSLIGVANTASFALTASYVNPLTQSVSIRGTGTTSATTALSIQNAGATSSLIVFDNGFVGIGTGSAAYNLDVNGGAFNNAFRVTGIARFTGASNSTGVYIENGLQIGSTISLGPFTFAPYMNITANSVSTNWGTVSFNTNNINAGEPSIILTSSPTNKGFTLGSTISGSSWATMKYFYDDGSMILQYTASSIDRVTSSIFTLNTTTRGFLPPRTNLTSNISTPAQGLITYITASSTEGLYYYNSGSFQSWTKVLNSIGTQTITGSLFITASAGTGSALTVYKSGSTVVSIQGSQGELFSITDSLSGSLFSVSNISGLPILEVFSDNTTLIGNYLDPMLVTTQLVTANSGSTTIYSLPTASYDGAFYDYVVRSGSNSRAGQIMAIWSGSSVNYTDNSTTDFGSTANLSFNVIISGSNMVLRSTVTTGSWTVKTIIRSI